MSLWAEAWQNAQDSSNCQNDVVAAARNKVSVAVGYDVDKISLVEKQAANGMTAPDDRVLSELLRIVCVWDVTNQDISADFIAGY